MSRTYLVVPGDDPVVLAKAPGHGADAVVVDLAASALDGPAARRLVASFLADVAPGPDVWVRINPGSAGHEDARDLLAAGGGLRGLCVARTESPVQLDTLDNVLSTVEGELGLPLRSVGVLASLESAGAVLAAAGIARAPRVARLYLAEDELTAELGLAPAGDERELLWLRSQVVVAGAAAGLLPPVASAPSRMDDRAALRASTMALKRLGYGGRACLDPAQIAIVDEVFRPSPEEVVAARDVVERYAAAQRDGTGLARDPGGRVIGEARMRRARDTLGRG